ncbi:MAG TPA: O-antigen ligase family protein [Gammaproteobacteria bacterium]|nr:O-antigen ligase family protein [Gammaproteobacteria bacterium]
MTRYAWGNRSCQIVITLAIAATAALALVIDRVDSYALLVLGLIGMYSGFRYGFGRNLRAGEKLFVWIAAAYAAVAIFAYLHGVETNQGFHVLGRYLRFIILIPAYLAMRRYAPPRRAVWLAFVAGSLIAACSGLVQYFQSSGVVRAAGDSIAITFGDLGLMSGFIAIVLTPTDSGSRRWLNLALGLLGVAGGLIASILSGTRGGWLAIPVFVVLAILALTRGMTLRSRLAIFVAGVVVAAAVVAVPATGMRTRIAEAVQGWTQYMRWRDAVAATPDSVCVSAEPLVRGLAQSAFRWGRYPPAIEAVRDRQNLAAGGFGARCDGWALHITAQDSHGGHLRISRIVDTDAMPGFVSVLARGNGYLYLGGGDRARVHSHGYRRVIIHDKPQEYRDYRTLTFAIRAGNEMWIVPEQVNPGAYRYFYTRGSVGARLAMWGTAWDIFTHHWIFGAGTGAYTAIAARRVQHRQAAPITAMYDHPHNQYLNSVATRGIIGLIELLLLLGVPAYLFAARFGADAEGVRRNAWAGMITVSGLAIFGLTETILNHSLVIDYYVIFVGLFAALMYAAEEDATLTHFHRNQPSRSDG